MAARVTFGLVAILAYVAVAAAQYPVLRPGQPYSGMTGQDGSADGNDWTTIRMILPPADSKSSEVTVSVKFNGNLGVGQYGRIQAVHGNEMGIAYVGESKETTQAVTLTIPACEFPGGGNFTLQVAAAFTFIVTVNIDNVPFEISVVQQDDWCKTVVIIIVAVVLTLGITLCLVCICMKTGCCSSNPTPAPAPAVATPQVIVMQPQHPVAPAAPMYAGAAPVAYPGGAPPAYGGPVAAAPGGYPQAAAYPPAQPVMQMATPQKAFACPFCATKNGPPAGYHSGMQIACCSCRKVFALP